MAPVIDRRVARKEVHVGDEDETMIPRPIFAFTDSKAARRQVFLPDRLERRMPDCSSIIVPRCNGHGNIRHEYTHFFFSLSVVLASISFYPPMLEPLSHFSTLCPHSQPINAPLLQNQI
jgi:hypothetical protein